MSKEQDSRLDYLGDAYSINIARAHDLRGDRISYVLEQAASLNTLAKVFCTDGAEYSAVILPHGMEDLPIYVSHPHGYGGFNSYKEKISLTKSEIGEISQKLKTVLDDVNNEENKKSLLRSLVRAQNPFISKIIKDQKTLLIKALKKQKAENINRDYTKETQKIEEVRSLAQYQNFVTKHCSTIFPKFLNEHDLTSIIQYKGRSFKQVLEVFDRYDQSLYRGVHVEAQGVDFAYERHRQQTREFSIGLAKKDTNPDVGCCAGCALEFKILSLREEKNRIIVHRSADFPLNVPPSDSYRPSPLINNEEMTLFKKIPLVLQGTENLIVREILSDKINTIDELSRKIEELTKTSQDVDQQLKKDKDTIEVLKAENKKLSEESSTTKEQFKKTQTQLKKKEEELKESQGTIDTLTKEMDKKVDTLETEKSKLEGKLTTAHEQLKRKEEESKKDNYTIGVLKEENKKLSEESSTTKEQFKKTQTQLKKKEEELTESQGKIDTLTKEMDKKVDTLEKEKSEVEVKLTTAHEQLKRKEEESKKDNYTIGVLKEENKKLSEELSTTKEQLEKTQTQLNIGSAEKAELINKNRTLEEQLEKLRQEPKRLTELEGKIKQLEESQKRVNVTVPSPGTNTNIEGQNLQQESIQVESNLVKRHSINSPEEQPEVKKRKLKEAEEVNLGAIAEAKQIGHGIAAVPPSPSSNSPKTVSKAPGKSLESPPRTP